MGVRGVGVLRSVKLQDQSLKKEDARRGGDTFCNKLQKKLLILEEYKSENYYSLIFECN